MADPTLAELLTKLYAALTGAAAITALVPAARIRNHLPQDAPLPAVKFRIDRVDEWDTKDSNGFDLEYIIDVWTDKHGDLEVMQILDAIYGALHKQELSLASGQSLLLYQRSVSVFEDDGVSHHGVAIYRHLATS